MVSYEKNSYRNWENHKEALAKTAEKEEKRRRKRKTSSQTVKNL